MPANSILDLTQVKPDFYDLVNAMQGELRNRQSWIDFYPGATGQTLMEFIAATGMYNQWSIEKALKEAFLSTARRDSSIYSIVRMLGIRITRKIPGVHTATLTRQSVSGIPITSALAIPAYTQFYVDSIPYFNRTTLVFNSGVDQLNGVFLHQGMVYQKEYYSDASPFQQFVIPSLFPMSISDADIQIAINGVTWRTVYEGMWNFGPNDNVVYDSTLGTGDVILQFGNGYCGAIPPANSRIVVTFAETLGAKNGLVASGTKVAAAQQFDIMNTPQVVEGYITKENIVYNISNTISTLALAINNTIAAIPTAELPVGNVWSSNHVGLQLEDGEGSLAVIIAINGSRAKLSVVSSFRKKLLPAGTWSLTTPAVGADEKSTTYYKMFAPFMFRANGKAITVNDHIAICMTYPGISDVLVRTERELLETFRIWINPYPGMPDIVFLEQKVVSGPTLVTSGDFSRNILCMESSSDYTIGLPSATGNEGQYFGLIADPTLTRLVNVDQGIGNLEMNEKSVLISDGIKWNKIQYIETQRSSHPELMNVIWMCILAENGQPWSQPQWTEFLNWFKQYQMAGTIIKPQNPSKELVNVTMRIMCKLNSNLQDIKFSAEQLVQDIFATNKPMLNKRIALSDIIIRLKNELPDIDYVEIISPTKDIIPTPSTLHAVTGAPSAPNYLALNQVIINVDFSDRAS